MPVHYFYVCAVGEDGFYSAATKSDRLLTNEELPAMVMYHAQESGQVPEEMLGNIRIITIYEMQGHYAVMREPPDEKFGYNKIVVKPLNG